jgi:ABC-type branched-subunit amino acid transport system substrate-binding protein
VTAGLLFPPVSKAAAGAADGATSAAIWTLATETEANATFKTAYEMYAKKRSICADLPMDKQMALSYSQLVLVAQAINKSGGIDPKAIHGILLTTDCDLPQGKVQFDESGQAQVSYTRIISQRDTVAAVGRKQ